MGTIVWTMCWDIIPSSGPSLPLSFHLSYTHTQSYTHNTHSLPLPSTAGRRLRNCHLPLFIAFLSHCLVFSPQISDKSKNTTKQRTRSPLMDQRFHWLNRTSLTGCFLNCTVGQRSLLNYENAKIIHVSPAYWWLQALLILQHAVGYTVNNSTAMIVYIQPLYPSN